MTRSPTGTAFDMTGPESAPVVALIHGLGLNRALWQWLAPHIVDRYRVLAYDLLGHGESSPPQPDPTLKSLSDQLTGLLDHLGIDKVSAVGFSLGGMVARRFAQDHPGRVAALGVLHSPHRRTKEAQAAIRARVEQARAEGPRVTVEAALVRWFTDDYRTANSGVMQLVRSWVLANDPDVYPDLYRILAEGVEEIVAPNPPIACPALVITADEDFGNGPEMTHAIAAEIANAETQILPGLRHMALVEDPPAVNAPLIAFLDRHLAAGTFGARRAGSGA
ncbi:3-oxoadipate enol-lactonase 2 [Defluviimonas aquaemixtae]|uniref:3-oxoadipate enol-lactonase 2 n=1 Tax=Albidovulum aquaemixtae TaxID=1542388 RepID=A0A2R8BLK2_9RHOB|nr:alpha/beta fold hydrolase [Defluviimonas aquaemixtae]SPH24245.1 3-oxoadipate enol-lactonase 2 [Defluviimonas aquaemixtae]